MLIFSGDFSTATGERWQREGEKKKKLFYLSGCCTVTRLWWHMLGSIGLLHNIAQNTDVGLLLDMPFWSQWELQLACTFIRHSLRWKYTGGGEKTKRRNGHTVFSLCVSVAAAVRPSVHNLLFVSATASSFLSSSGWTLYLTTLWSWI